MEPAKENVFICWSGDRSRSIAEALQDWLAHMFQRIEPWASEGIEKGARWSEEIRERLESTRFGLVCLTRENQHSPWINFEAGAISKTLGSVVPVLVDLRAVDVTGPLAQFQCTTLAKDDLRKLARDINGTLLSGQMREGILDTTFDKWWDRLEPQIMAVPNANEDSQSARPHGELLEDILMTVRSLERRSQSGSDGQRRVSWLADFEPRPAFTYMLLASGNTESLARFADELSTLPGCSPGGEFTPKAGSKDATFCYTYGVPLHDNDFKAAADRSGCELLHVMHPPTGRR